MRAKPLGSSTTEWEGKLLAGAGIPLGGSSGGNELSCAGTATLVLVPTLVTSHPTSEYWLDEPHTSILALSFSSKHDTNCNPPIHYRAVVKGLNCKCWKNYYWTNTKPATGSKYLRYSRTTHTNLNRLLQRTHNYRTVSNFFSYLV